jgi:hypothetical protein
MDNNPYCLPRAALRDSLPSESHPFSGGDVPKSPLIAPARSLPSAGTILRETAVFFGLHIVAHIPRVACRFASGRQIF